MNEDKGLMPRSDVAQRLGVSVQTVGRMIARGELEAVRVGQRLVRVTTESYESYRRKAGAK